MKSSTFELGLTKKQNQGRRFHCSQRFSIKRFTHVASSYANWKKKKRFYVKKGSTPTGRVWHTNMAVVMSCENNPIVQQSNF